MASRSRNELFSVLMVGIIIVSGFLTTTVTSIMTDVDVLKNPSSDIDCISEINEELKVLQNNEKEDALVGNIKSSTFPKIAPSKYNSARPVYPSGSGGNYEILYSSSPVSPDMQNIIDHHCVEDAWLQGCDGSGVNVAVVDTGVDFAHIDLYGTHAKVGISAIENETVITAKGGENWAYLKHGNIVDGSYTVYKNYVSMIEGTANDYTLNLTTGNISFTSPLVKWDNITAYYHYYPTYYGWPIAYDPSSMAKFLKNNDTKETWYANTSVVGEGPFEVSHWIKIDGTNDFAEKIEKWGTDRRDNEASGLGGDKEDYDLTDLYLTRDSENWYVGFPTYCIEKNVTFGLLIDVDNETSGSVSTPEGKLVDTNTSHTNFVHDAAFSPDGSMVASLSKDSTVKVWMRDGKLFHNLIGHGENIPYSLAWSPNSSWLATVDQYEVIVWDVMSGEVVKRIQYESYNLYKYYVLTSTVSFSPNGTWLAVAGGNQVFIFNTSTWNPVGSLKAGAFKYSIAFNPNGSWIGCVGSNDIGVFALNSTNIRTSWGIGEFSIPLYTLTGHTQPILSISWSPNGEKMVSGGNDNTVRLWNVTDESTWKTLTYHSTYVYSVGWSADGMNFASSSGDTTIKIYDSEGNLLKDIDSTGHIYAINWSGENEIVSASSDLTVRIWNDIGEQTGIMVAHKPDYCLYATGWSLPRGEDEWIHGMENATLYKWNSSCDAWEGIELQNETIDGRQASFQFGEMLFNEFAIPRIAIGDPDAIAVELFSVSTDISHAQDTVQSDVNVLDMDHDGEEDKGLDWIQVYTSLSNFAFRKMELYEVEEGIVSASNNFHFGYHPSPVLIKRYGSIGILVVDSISNGTYDRIYVDFNNNKIFEESDVFVSKDSPIAALDNYNATADAAGDVANKTTPDGYPDISGGMLYFISDGHTPIPYSDVYCDRKNIDNIIPGNGNLICFIGEFGTDPDTKERTDHGTKIASAIVAQGKLDTYVIDGTAPGAKIITIGNAFSDLSEAWYFAVEGYDGKPGTGDEARIVCNGFNYPEIYEDGFDRYSRLADYLSMSYANGKTIFVASGGDDGYGYGTISSPSSCPGVIAVGTATDYSRLASQHGGSEGQNPHYGDVTSSSSRGPSALGVPKPDVVAIGTAIVDLPLGPVGFTSDGREAYTHPLPWEGSDASCAATAGVLALIYDAYNQTHGEYPNTTTARSLLMSGADDANYDILCQGAGFVNASRSVKLALDIDGISVTPSFWVPGDYNGAKYESFVKLMHAGEDETAAFSINNHGTADINITVSDRIFDKTIGYNFSIPSQKNWFTSKGDIVILMNETGIYQLPATFSIPPLPPQKIMDIDPDLWNGTDLLKVTMHANYSQQVIIKGDNEYELDYWYMLTLQDWEYNGSLTNRDMFTYFPLPSIYSQEVNTINKIGIAGNRIFASNVLECRVSEPSKTKDGLVINLEAAGEDYMLEGLMWNVVIECYQKSDWSWIKLNGQDGAISLSVPMSGIELNATVNVPLDAGIGSYEGAIYIDEYKEVTNEFVVEATIYSVIGESVINATGGEIFAYLDYCPIVDSSYTLYLNDTEWPKAGNYSINLTTEKITFVNPLGAGDNITTDYDWYDYVNATRLDFYPVVDSSYTLYLNGTEWPEAGNYSIDLMTGVIAFINSLEPGDNITADYNYYRVTTIPILINVAANSTKFTFGGNTLTSDLYNNNKMFGGYNKYLSNDKVYYPYTGDWRFYYFDIPNQGLFANREGLKTFVDVEWDKKFSDIDVILFQKASADTPSKNDASRFGPYPLTNAGGSEETDRPEFKTTTNDSEEAVAVDLAPGLNVIALHNVILNGSTCLENISGEVGYISASQKVEKITNGLAGDVPIHFSSNLNWSGGVSASAVGPAISEKNESIEIPQDYQSWWRFPNWGEYLREGSFTRNLTLERVLMLDVHIWGDDDCPDLDLGVFRDINENWELDDDEVLDANCIKAGGTYWDYDADADADEHLVWVAPPDGQYIVKVLGFTIMGSIGHFDMEISITLDTGGKGYKILEAGEEDSIIDSTIGGLSPYTRITFNMSWDFPSNQKDGEYGGAVLVGPPQAPDIIVIPANIVLDRMEPDISELQIMTSSALQVNYLDNSTTNDNMLTLVATIADMDRGELNHSTVNVSIDGVDVSSQAIVSIPFADPDGQQGSLGYGYWIGMITYTPYLPLSDMGHNIEVKVSDVAGNTASRNWTFTIDTQAPNLVLNTPSPDISTNVNVTTISGKTTPGSTLFIRGKEIEVEDDGSFSTEEKLEEGVNEIPITAVDWFDWDDNKGRIPGNTATITRIITLDTTKPRFSRITTLTTSITNKDATTIIGKIEDERSEDVVLTVNDILTAVNSDGIFMATLLLEEEGENEINIIATDSAGNTNETSMTIVRDTIKPILTIEALSPNAQGVLNIKGTTEQGATITINGKPVPVVNGAFNKEIDLSYGANLIVIESKDAAGNVEEIREVVMYSSIPVIGFLPLSLISMIALLLIGLFVGYVLLGRIKISKKIEEEEEVGEELEEEEEEEPGKELEAEEEIEKEAETEEEEMGKESEEEAPEKDLEELGKELFGEE